MGKDRLELPKEEYEFFKDRLFTVSLLIERILQQHPVAKIHPEIKEHVSSAVDELYKASHKLNNLS